MLTPLLNHCRGSKKFAFLFITFLSINFVARAQSPTGGQAGKSTFTAKLMNIEAAAGETFRYTANLNHGGKPASIYELKADLPIGWQIVYRVDGSQVGSINMEAGKMQDVAIEINPTASAEPRKYKIPVKAISSSDTLLLKLEAVVKGSYGLALSTPSGRLSEEITSGSQTEIQLTVKNTGTLPLNEVDITSQLPANWEATFEPAKIKQLEAGKTVNVTAKLKVPDKTIVGDYAATFTASNGGTNAQAAFRMIVKTPLLSGWIGILVILAAIGLIYYLIRKYGRR